MRIIKKRKKWGGSRGGDIAIFILLVLIGTVHALPDLSVGDPVDQASRGTVRVPA